MIDNTEHKAEDYQGGNAGVSTGAGTGAATAAAPAYSNPFASWLNKQIAQGRNLTLDIEGRELKVVEFTADNRVKVERLAGGHDLIVLTDSIAREVMDQMV